MQIEWSARALLRSARAGCPRNDEDRGSVRAGKRTERWCGTRGKLGQVGGGDGGGWGTELDLGRGACLDNDHGPAAVGTSPERTGLLGSGDGGFDLRLRHHAE